MKEKVMNFLDNVKAKWLSLELKQKITIIAIIVALILALGITLYATTRPNMEVLVNNQEAKLIYQIQNTLTESGIESTVAQGETALLVKSQDLTQAKKLIVEAGITDTGFSFADALDSMSMGTTSDVKKAILARESESKLETQLATFDGINKATVTLQVPDDSNFFIESKQVTTAAVSLDLKKDLTSDQVNAIAAYVLSAVKGLQKENLVITNSKADILYYGESEASGSYNSQYKIELEKKSEIEKKVKQMLAPVYADVKIMSNIVFNWDKQTESKEVYSSPFEDGTKGIVRQEDTSSSSVKTENSSDEPGLNTNGGDITQYQTGESGNTEAKSDDKSYTYEINSVKTNTEKQSGDIIYDDSSLLVAVYRYKTYDQEVLEERGELDNMTWTEYKEQVPEKQFTVAQELIDSVAIGTGIENVRIIGYEIPQFVDKVEIDRPIDQYIMLIILVILIAVLAFALIKKTSPAEVTEIEPELSVEKIIDTLNKKQEYVSPIDVDADSEIKKQIEKFVDERPEAVAQLLRNWLTEEWE